MEQKEPGYWVRWAAGIAATVVAGVLVAVVAGAFEDDRQDPPPPTPAPTPTSAPNASVSIAQFEMTAGKVGTYPTASFTVFNGGDDIAKRCELEWHPLDKEFDDIVSDRAEYSREFAVAPRSSEELELRSSTPYTAGLFTSGARVTCANARSEIVTQHVLGYRSFR